MKRKKEKKKKGGKAHKFFSKSLCWLRVECGSRRERLRGGPALSWPPTKLAASVRRTDRRAAETFAHVPLWRHGSPKEYKPGRASRSSSRVVSVTRQVHHEIVNSGKLVFVLEWPSDVRGREWKGKKKKRLSKVLYNLSFLTRKNKI